MDLVWNRDIVLEHGMAELPAVDVQEFSGRLVVGVVVLLVLVIALTGPAVDETAPNSDVHSEVSCASPKGLHAGGGLLLRLVGLGPRDVVGGVVPQVVAQHLRALGEVIAGGMELLQRLLH